MAGNGGRCPARTAASRSAESGMNPTRGVTMNKAAMNTNIQRSANRVNDHGLRAPESRTSTELIAIASPKHLFFSQVVLPVCSRRKNQVNSATQQDDGLPAGRRLATAMERLACVEGRPFL